MAQPGEGGVGGGGVTGVGGRGGIQPLMTKTLPEITISVNKRCHILKRLSSLQICDCVTLKSCKVNMCKILNRTKT